MSEWFESWFDSPYYHLLYKNRDNTEAEIFINNLIQYLSPEPNALFLDLACGKGRHSVQLNKSGLNVVGADYSKNSINYARQFQNERLTFLEHDMREPFNTKFDYILNLFTSFGYFNSKAEHITTLQNVYNGLKDVNEKDRGIFVLDFLNSRHCIKSLIPSQTIESEGVSFEITRRQEQNKIIKDIKVTDHENVLHFSESVMAFSKSELISMCNEVGFELVEYFGDYNLEEFNADDSKRLILILKKC
jgi:SAM-dependent methyltransferase